jgi:hypothetical protein
MLLAATAALSPAGVVEPAPVVPRLAAALLPGRGQVAASSAAGLSLRAGSGQRSEGQPLVGCPRAWAGTGAQVAPTAEAAPPSAPQQGTAKLGSAPWGAATAAPARAAHSPAAAVGRRERPDEAPARTHGASSAPGAGGQPPPQDAPTNPSPAPLGGHTGAAPARLPALPAATLQPALLSQAPASVPSASPGRGAAAGSTRPANSSAPTAGALAQEAAGETPPNPPAPAPGGEAEPAAAGEPASVSPPSPTQPPSTSPDQPSSTTPTPSLAGPEPQTPFPPQHLSEDQVAVQADKLFVTERFLVAEGKVVVRTAEYTITADAVEIDRQREVARFRGQVAIEGHHQRTVGHALWLDLDSGWWRLEEGRTQVQPEFFTTEVLEPLFGRARSAEYEPRLDRLSLRRGELTSCALPDPHYALRSRRVQLRPGDKVTFYKPSLYVLGHRVFQYPFNLTMSLREEEQKIFPEVGENEVEGQYLKLAFLYLMGAHNSGVARLNLTQRRGLGLGLDHALQDHRQTLDLSVFNEPAEGALAGSFRHAYTFSSSLRSDASLSYQRNSGFLYTARTLTSDLTFRNLDRDSDTTLGFQRSQSSYGGGSSQRTGSSFSHSQRLGRRTRWDLRGTYSRNSFSGQEAADEELDTDFVLRHTAPAYDLELEASNRYDVDGSRYRGDDGYYALNRLPWVALSSDSQRLGGGRVFGSTPARVRLELGQFAQDPEGEKVFRTAFISELGGGERRLGAATAARTALRFRQSWFSEGSAQYNLAFDGELRHAWDSHWQTRLSYDYATTRGFAPLRVDYGGKANELHWQVVRWVADRSRLELSSGYDFVSDEFRDLRFLAELRASRHSYCQLQTAYSLAQKRWWPLVGRYATARRNLYLDLTSSYDLDKSQLSTVTADLDLRLGRWWRVEFVGSYSGWTKQLDQADVRLTRDLHCLVAQLIYTKWPRELTFNLGLKAFPAPARTLGIGRTGAYLPSLPGQQF